MSSLRRGFLYWARADERRPLLAVSSDDFNARSGYVCVVPATPRLRPLRTHVPLVRGEGGIDRPSMLLCEHLLELRLGDFDPEPLGPPLPPARMRAVEAAIRLYLDLDAPS
jgi:mRNA-degrading endonuclease toxin of MazEF toxin-antitoxin module